MNTHYKCKNEGRIRELSLLKDSDGKPLLNCIDYLEVDPADQTLLLVHFLYRLPGSAGDLPPYTIAGLDTQNIRIQGGVRIRNIKPTHVQTSENLLRVTVSEAGDFSEYTLSVVSSPTESSVPAGFDQICCSVEFNFKVNCPGEFDCISTIICPTEKIPEPRIDYLAKDYGSFRQLMLDRLSTVMPDWKERNPADVQVMLIEVLAYVADQLSYYQDAVATEAYLGTARRRVSLKRHARLLDYFMHDGCNARTWIHIGVEKGSGADGIVLPKGTPVLIKGTGASVSIKPALVDSSFDSALRNCFETMHPLKLNSAHNEIFFYTWGNLECCLPGDSTKSTLINDPPLNIKPNDLLLFEEAGSSPSLPNNLPGQPKRHVVRLTRVEPVVDALNGLKLLNIEWHEADKLPFPLCISRKSEGKLTANITIARGNIVLADHGYTLKDQALYPELSEKGWEYRPQLLHKGITAAAPYNHLTDNAKPAVEVIVQDPHEAFPVISLSGTNGTWSVQKDLLGSDRFANEFVAETEEDGKVFLRFGDDVMGRKPETGFKPSASYRIGNGKKGNLGADTLRRIITDTDGIILVTNPLPAQGGTDPESLSEVREFAPQAFRKQERAVTEADYAEKAQLHKQVQKAAARFRWTGSWFTVFLYIDRKGGKEVDFHFMEELYRHMETYRMAGYDLEIKGPSFVPLEVALTVCVKPDHLKSAVKANLLETFSRFYLPANKRGFFHPDNFTFGQPLYLSSLYATAMQVPGVASAEVQKFQRWAKIADREIDKARIEVSELEIIRLDNDPNFPENGKIEFIMYGGI